VTGISIQYGTVHCWTGPEVDITRLSTDYHHYLRSLLVSICTFCFFYLCAHQGKYLHFVC